MRFHFRQVSSRCHDVPTNSNSNSHQYIHHLPFFLELFFLPSPSSSPVDFQLSALLQDPLTRCICVALLVSLVLCLLYSTVADHWLQHISGIENSLGRLTTRRSYSQVASLSTAKFTPISLFDIVCNTTRCLWVNRLKMCVVSHLRA